MNIGQSEILNPQLKTSDIYRLSSVLWPLSSVFGYRPQVIQAYAAKCSEKIGKGIKDFGVSEGYIVLVNFITDAVKRCGYHTEQDQHSRIAFNPQGLIGPVK